MKCSRVRNRIKKIFRVMHDAFGTLGVPSFSSDHPYDGDYANYAHYHRHNNDGNHSDNSNE